MAAIRFVCNRWRAEVRRLGVYISATFEEKEEAEMWAREREHEIRLASKMGQMESLRAIHGPRHQAPREIFADTLQERDIVMQAKPYAPTCGVYFLVRRGEVVYVGSSVDVYGRLTQHRQARREFDAVHVIQTAPTVMRAMEAKYILALRPVMNHGLDGNLVIPMRKNELTRIRNEARA